MASLLVKALLDRRGNWRSLVRHAGAAAAGHDAHAVTHTELLAWVDLLHHGDRAALVKAHRDLDAIAGAHCLLGMGADSAAHQGAADGTCGVGGSALADSASEETTGDTAYHRACGVVTFNFDRADGGDFSGANGLGLAGIALRIDIPGEGVLRTRSK